MFNILQVHKDGRTELMLGLSVDKRDDLIPFLTRYICGRDETNKRRIALGHEPLDCTYQVIEVECEKAEWFPQELVP